LEVQVGKQFQFIQSLQINDGTPANSWCLQMVVEISVSA
jgi:hypothetical protein